MKNKIICLVLVLGTVGLVLVHFFIAPYDALKRELNKITPPQSIVDSNTSNRQIFAGCPCMKRTLTTTKDISQLTDDFVTSLTNAGYVVITSPSSYSAPSRKSMYCGGSNQSSETEDKTIGLCTLEAETAENHTGAFHRVQVSLSFKKSLVDAALTPGEDQSSSYLDSTTKYVASSVTIDIRNR